MSSEEEESESSEEEKPKKKQAQTASERARRAATPRKSFKEESSDSEEEEEEEDDDDDEEEDNDDEEGSNEENGDDDNGSEEEEEDEDDEDEPKRKKSRKSSSPKKKTSNKKKKSSSSTKKSSRKSTSSNSSPKKKKVKKDDGTTPKVKKAPTKMKLLENAMKSYKWWEAEPLEQGVRWRTLEHMGVQFPPPYTPHGVPLIYDGRELHLDPESEEMATYFAACIGSQQLEKASTAKTFTGNFFKQFKEFLPKDTVIKEFSKCDFSKIRGHLDAERERKKEMSKEQKEKMKQEEDRKKLKYAFAVVDGSLMKVASTLIEPPGLFRGRGEHPKAGLLKPRVMPEDVTLNIGEGACVPECPLVGHSWGRIVHNHTTTWLANWKDMNGKNKYVQLSASSHFKGQTDREKYERARRLKKIIPQIRSNYLKGMEHGDTSRDRQIATAMWVIDRLALRVGGEKEDDEADTVGTCSLRVEHMKLEDPYMMTLDFLGKDSMRHFQTYNLADEKYEGSGQLVYKCLKSFVKDKKETDQIFDSVNPTILNDHLKTIMPELTAKVFRTYNASFTLEKELPKLLPKTSTVEEKEAAYNDANRKVAILCNHQRSVSKAQEVGFEKKQKEISELENQIEELKKMKKRVDADKEIELKPEDVKEEDKKKFSHLFERQPTSDQVEKRISVWEKKLDSLKHKTSEAEKSKTVALNTSKINYMDPRISVAWAKRNECPIEKIYSATQRDKFPWAMSESDAFEF